MARFLDRLARGAARHHWIVMGIWLAIAVGLVFAAQASGGKTIDNFTIPGTQSQEAADLLESQFPSQSGDTASVVFQAQTGKVTDAANAAAIDTVQTALAKLPHVTGVNGPATPTVGAAFVSQDGTIGYASVQYDEAAPDLGTEAFEDLEEASQPAVTAGLRVEYGGPVVDYGNQVESLDSDKVGLVVAVIILLLAFGSVVAMSLPIGVAVFGLGFGLSIITLLAAVTDIGSVAPTLATMIGLGVGIDYSLFIVTRHRQNLAQGMDVNESIGLANGTAGQAVLFAGGTVVIAICGLAVAGIPYVTKLGFTSAIVVAVMIAAALTLLPALLGLAGRHIDSLHIPRLRRRRRPERADDGGGWRRWAHFMSRHRWAAVIVSLAILLVLAVPLFGMRLGQTDDGTDPKSTTQRQAYDLIAEGFGPGANGPLVLAMALPKAGDTASAGTVQQAVSQIPDVRVTPPQFNPDEDAAVIIVVPASAPDSESTADLVSELRDDVLPAAVKGTGAKVYVGGVTAAFIDLGDRIKDRLPLFIGAVVGLSFVLLMMVFRSVLVPLKAAVMNLLSIGAAYGVIVAVFQWGWLRSVVGLDDTVPIVAFVPMMMFAILFGLSMDYEVFLLSRIREDYQESGDNLESVVNGIASTARVITSAALIMISVFLAFVPNPNPTVKMFGLGLAVAVFVDATIVRLVLVPATMELLGDANWWLPKWLDRILPKIEIE
ncbi:MAG: MMPL family transporter [Acidimicrobiia bacterium]